MTTKDSLIQRYEVFFLAATLAAHAGTLEIGFRQRDLRFYMDLFINWTYPHFDFEQSPLSNTQIMRFINQQQKSGHAILLKRTKQLSYRLTHRGIVFYLSQLQQRDYADQYSQSFFVCYFLKNYVHRFVEQLKLQGKSLRSRVQLEVDTLVNLDLFIERQVQALNREKLLLEKRIKLSQAMSKRATQAKTSEDLQALVEGRGTGMHTFKDLARVGTWYAEDILRWELTAGATARSNDLWLPALERINSVVQQFQALREKVGNKI